MSKTECVTSFTQQLWKAASRAEDGNEKYDYYFSPDNDNELLLIELWTSAEAVWDHAQTPHFKKLGELKQMYVADTTIMRYDITDDGCI